MGHILLFLWKICTAEFTFRKHFSNSSSLSFPFGNLFCPLRYWYASIIMCTHSYLEIGFVAFVLMLKKGFYKYQVTQMTWTIMTLVVIVVQSNFIVKNLFEGIVWYVSNIY